MGRLNVLEYMAPLVRIGIDIYEMNLGEPTLIYLCSYFIHVLGVQKSQNQNLYIRAFSAI